MIGLLAVLGFILIFFISALGWGRLAFGLIYKHPANSIAYEVTLGFTLWVLIGGPLNFFSLVSPLIIDGLLLLGVLFSGILAYRYLQEKSAEDRDFSLKKVLKAKKSQIGILLLEGVPAFIIIAATLFFVSTVLPSGAFNFHDDFYKYLPRLVRLLQSGTLGGTPFDYVGSDSLGAHSFLQSFFATHFPLQYINGFDAVFCFLLGGLLLNDIGRKSGLPWYYRSGVIIMYIMINPQYVNISALYSGSLMILALIYASLLFCDYLEWVESKEMLLASIPVALIGATLLGLKHTFVPFSAVYFALFFILLIGLAEKRKNILVAASISIGSAGLILFPWVWAVSDKLIRFYFTAIGNAGPKSLPQEQLETVFSFLSPLLSSEKLFYGGAAIEYSLIVLCVFIAALWALYLLKKKEDFSNRGFLFVSAAAGVSATIAYLVNVYMAREVYVGIRFSCPIIIAVFPAMAVLLGRYLGFSKNVTYEMGFVRKLCGVSLILVIGLGSGIMMMDGWLGRLNKTRHIESMISYPVKQNYLVYMKDSFSNLQKDIVHDMQEKTEENSIILSWFDTPFLLDFARNKIFTVAGSGLGKSSREKLEDPSIGGEWLREYLKNIGVRYVIWGYKGAPKEGKNHKYLMWALADIWDTSRVIYDDGQRVVFEID